MADKPFVVNDRRKFNADGEPRPDAAPSEPRPPRDTTPVEFSSASHAQPKGPQAVPPPPPHLREEEQAPGELPPPPTAEQTQQAPRPYDATVQRLDTALH